MIDRIRHDIQHRLDQLLVEAEKLRRALTALDPRQRLAPAAKTANARRGAKPPARNATPAKPGLVSSRTRAGTAKGARPRARTAPGETKAKVVAALSSDTARTASEVAAVTGLPSASVSSTLSRLAKAGDVKKARRGYVLPGDPSAASNPESPAAPTDTEA